MQTEGELINGGRLNLLPDLSDNWIQNFYLRIYGRKFSLTVMREWSRKMWFPNVYPTIYHPKWNFELINPF